MHGRRLPTPHPHRIMSLSPDLATWRRQKFLETLRWCQRLSDGMKYRPTIYRPKQAMIDDAARDLPALMGYRKDQPAF